MFKSEKPLICNLSASALSNNISNLVLEHRSLIYYAVISRHSVNLLSSAFDGHAVNQKLIYCKEPKTSKMFLIQQTRLLVLYKKVILVIAAESCIQFYDVENSNLITHFNLNILADEESYARGICLHDDHILCGTNVGSIYIFESSPEKSEIIKKNSIEGHKSAIWSMCSHLGKLISSDDYGNIMIWNSFNAPKRSLNIISGQGYPCTSLAGINNTVIGAYGSGHIRLFDFLTGDIIYEISAHAGWINSIDVASQTSVIISAGEDSFIRLWKLTDSNIENIHNEHIVDERLMGVMFLTDRDDAFVCSAYDSDKLFFYSRK